MQGLGQGWGKVRARLGQGLDKKQGSGKVWAGKVWARLGQVSGKVGERLIERNVNYPFGRGFMFPGFRKVICNFPSKCGLPEAKSEAKNLK